MTAKPEFDLENERIQLDGAWLSSDDLSAKVTQALQAKNFGGVGRLGEALEQLAQAVQGAKTLSFDLKLSSDQFARIEAAGQRLGKSAQVYARDLLLQVLQSANPPPSVVAPAAAPPVIAPAALAPLPVGAPPVSAPPLSAPPVSAPPVIAAPAPELDEAAVTLTPKRPTLPPPMVTAPPPPAAPPVMSPAGPPVMTPVAAAQPSVVVDLGPEDGKPKPGQPDGRRWFNRS